MGLRVVSAAWLAFFSIFAICGSLIVTSDFLLDKKERALLAALGAPVTLEYSAPKTLSVDAAKLTNITSSDFITTSPMTTANRRLPASAKAYVGDPVVSGVTLSPAGRYVSAVQSDENGNHVVVYDTQEQDGPIVFNFDNLSVDWVRWASEDRLLIGYSLIIAFQIYDFQFLFGGARVLAVNRDGSNAVSLFESKPSVLTENFNLQVINHLLPNEPDHVLMSAFNGRNLAVWKVNIQTGDGEVVTTGSSNTGGWFVDTSGRPILRIDFNRRGTFARIYSRSTASGDWRQISQGPINPHRTPNIWPTAASTEANEVYVLANAENEDKVALKRFDIASGTLEDTVFQHDDVDVNGAVVDVRTREYLGAWYINDKYHVEFADKTLQKHYDGLVRFFDRDANVYINAGSRASGKFLVYVSGPTFPGEYYIYDYNRANITPLFSARPYLGDEDLSPVEIVKYRARDGMNLTAYVTHPAGKADEPAPLVVMPHGGPESRDFFDYHGTAQYLASRGYRIIQPNFRGSSGYGKAFAEAGYGEWGAAMQTDIDDAALLMKARGLVHDDDICIVGGSYGGYAALVGAYKAPHLYKCAVSISGVSDLVEFMQQERKEEGAGSATYKYWLRSIGDPGRDKDRLLANSPLHHAADISIPVLLIHGAADEVVSPDQSRLMREALHNAEGDVAYFEFKNAKHRKWDEEDMASSVVSVEMFLYKHLFKEHETLAMAAGVATQERIALRSDAPMVHGNDQADSNL